MAVQPKMVQLDLFTNSPKELEMKLKKDTEDSLKRQIRNLFHQNSDTNKRLDRLEEALFSLVDTLKADQ